MIQYQLHDEEFELILDLRELTETERLVIRSAAHTLREAHRATPQELPAGVVPLRPQRSA